MKPEMPQEQPVVHQETDLARRAALLKLGKFSLYAAPAILVLTNSRKAAAASVRPPT
jgi:hypothetical protein